MTRLIQLYIVGVFVSFTTSQTGMVRHWTRLLRTEHDPAGAPPACSARRVINAIGLTITGAVLVVVLVTKFAARRLDRASLAMARALRAHAWRSAGTTTRCAASSRSPDEDGATAAARRGSTRSSWSRKLHKPTLRALAYARATRPSMLEAVTVEVDADETAALQAGVGAPRASRCR